MPDCSEVVRRLLHLQYRLVLHGRNDLVIIVQIKTPKIGIRRQTGKIAVQKRPYQHLNIVRISEDRIGQVSRSINGPKA